MYSIGIVLDRAAARAAVYDEEYRALAVKETAVESGAFDEAAALVGALLAESGVAAQEVGYIGAAVAREWGCPRCAVAELSRLTGIRTLAERLPSAKALGEAYLDGDVDSLSLVCVGEGIESGVVMDRKVYESAARGGDVAHMVIDLDGYECSCGRRGCFEAYAGVAGLRRIAKEEGVAGADELTVTALFALEGDAAAAAQKRYVAALASGLTTVVNLFQARVLVIEGALAALGDRLMAPVLEIILRDQFTHLSPNKCAVRFANAAADTALIGAALLGR